MKKRGLFFMNNEGFLSLDNEVYKKAVDDYFWWNLRQDLGESGDITTKLLPFSFNKKVTAEIRFKSNFGVLAGREEIEFFLRNNNIKNYEFFYEDRDYIRKKDGLIARITAKASEILAYERIILNLLQSMTSVATNTRIFIFDLEKVKSRSVVAATRKNPLGLIDKKAVSIGGGLAHRLGLFDAILIKDNHLSVLGRENDIFLTQKYIDKINKSKASFFEVECDSLVNFIHIIDLFEKAELGENLKKDFVIMFDNFTPKEAKKAVKLLKDKKLDRYIYTEISGGINLFNLEEYGKCGTDIISTSFLSLATKHVDIGMDFV